MNPREQQDEDGQHRGGERGVPPLRPSNASSITLEDPSEPVGRAGMGTSVVRRGEDGGEKAAV